jgi:hypothetical protein
MVKKKKVRKGGGGGEMDGLLFTYVCFYIPCLQWWQNNYVWGTGDNLLDLGNGFHQRRE